MEVIIVAYGFEYLVMAIANARSIRATNPGLAVTLVTNAPRSWSFLSEEFDRIEFRDEATGQNRRVKIRVDRVALADRVLYLDADALVRGDLRPAFAMLDEFDLLIRPFELPSKFAHQLRNDVDGQLFPQFWGGMWFFRRSEVTGRFFARWEERFVASGLRRDQPALARAILDIPELRVLPMNAVWGTFAADLPDYPPSRPQPRIYHYADVSNDRAALSTCHGALADVLAALPADQRRTNEIRDTATRLRRLSSPVYRLSLTRQAACRWWALRDRLMSSGPGDPRKKRPHAAGAILEREAGSLWAD